VLTTLATSLMMSALFINVSFLSMDVESNSGWA